MRREENIKNLIPDGYSLLEYIQTTGTQWIESGINATTSNSPIELFADITLTQFTGDDYLIGVNGNNNSSRITPLAWYSGNAQVVMNSYTAQINYVIFSNYNAGVNIKHSYHTIWSTTNLSIFVDDALIQSKNINIPDYDSGYTFPIFGKRWRSSTVDSMVKCKLYYLKLVLSSDIYEYYPVLRKTDNKPGLYDVMHNNFLTNSGSGEFQYN